MTEITEYELRSAIAFGRLQPGTQRPAKTELREAFRRLGKDGLVVRRQARRLHEPNYL